jgi:hypothetical protein
MQTDNYVNVNVIQTIPLPKLRCIKHPSSAWLESNSIPNNQAFADLDVVCADCLFAHGMSLDDNQK